MLHRSRLEGFFRINHADEDVRRRGLNVIVIASISWAMALVVVLLLLMQPEFAAALPAALGGLLLYSLAIFLTHRFYVTAAALLLVGSNLLGITVSLIALPLLPNVAIYLVMPLLMAGITLPTRYIWLVGALSLIPYIMYINLPINQDVGAIKIKEELVIDVFFVCGFAALISMLSSRTTIRALRNVQQARSEAESALLSLEQINQTLEDRVAERTQALSAALDAQAAQAHDLQEALTSKQQLNQLLAEVSLPIIPVMDDVLVMPLVGELTAERATLLVTRMLAQIEQQRVRTIILDVTGIPILDQELAQVLIQATAATQLLGAQPVLVGIRPEVAQALISLGVDFATVQTAATLQQALERLLKQRYVWQR